jgi:hypothetical protein
VALTPLTPYLDDTRSVCKIILTNLDWNTDVARLDVIFASQHVTRPLYAFEQRFELPQYAIPACDPPILPLNARGGGFDKIVTPLLRDTLSACNALTIHVEFVCRRGFEDDEHRAVLAQRALAAQHALCSLAPIEPPSSYESTLHEVVRISALLYSDMVLFVMPQASGVRQKLLQGLRNGLAFCISTQADSDRRRLIVWALVIGAVASRTVGPGSSWFEDALRDGSLNDLGAACQANFLEWSHQLLWCESLLSRPALNVWTTLRPDTESSDDLDNQT